MFTAMASVLRKLGYNNFNTASLDKFKDKGTISEYAKSDLVLLANNGLLAGKGEPDIISAKDKTTRAEATVIIERLLKFIN